MDVDGISGPTPPFGFPDQGWGGNDRPAITMTHYAAETFCLWLSKKTGKNTVCPQRQNGNTLRVVTPDTLLLSGNQKTFLSMVLEEVLSAKTDNITTYVMYEKQF